MKNVLKTSFSKAAYTGKAATIILYLIYGLFALFSIFKIVTEPSYYGKVCYAIIAIIMLGVIYYSESLKRLYTKAIYQLTMETNAKKANDTFQQLIRKEKGAKAYKNSYILFQTMYYLDQREYKKCIEHCIENEQFLKNSIDNLFIDHFSLFYAYYKLNDLQSAKEEYTKLIRLKGAKKLSPLYSWELIEAMNLMVRKDYKQAYNTFKKVNTENMNNREKIQYYVEFAECCRMIKDKDHANHYFKLAAQGDGSSMMKQYAKEQIV